jgi:tyrosinase
VDEAMALDVYDEAPWNTSSNGNVSFRNRLEGWSPNPPILHNQVHVWIGGTMGTSSSPNDPVFFLHHCNEDRLWAEWQDADSSHGYLPLEPLENRPGHGINENLAIFSNDSTVRSVLEYRSLGYEYDTSVAAPAEPAVPLGDIAFVPPEWETNPYGAVA